MSLLFLFGASELSVSKENAAALTDLCALLHILSDCHTFDGDNFRFTVPVYKEKELTAVLTHFGISYILVKRKGLLSVSERYKRRVGLFVGLLLLAFIISSASSVVWRIDIVGNTILTNDEVLAALKDSGLSLGTHLGDIDTDSIERRAVVVEKRLSWISVNMNGTTAYVEVRERIDADKPQRLLPYANVVSTEDAIIVDIETLSGMATVKKGSYVRKGEMLINGIISKEALGTYPTYATGRVIGRVHKHFEIEFPYRYPIMEETGRKKVGVCFDIFGKEIVFLPFASEYESNTVTTKCYGVKEGRKSLPFSLTVNTVCEQAPRFAYRTADDAQREAIRFLLELLSNDYPNAEIAERSITITETEESVILYADITLDCEIGRVSEFDIDN